MPFKNKFRIAIRIPEVFYVLRDHESCEPENFIAEEELIKRHQSDKKQDEPIPEEVQLGRDQIDTICRMLKSEFTTETKNITSFKPYIHNLESNSQEKAIKEVENFLIEMRDIEKNYKGINVSNFFLDHWSQYGEDFYFILKSIDSAGIRVVRNSRQIENLSDEQKTIIYLEKY